MTDYKDEVIKKAEMEKAGYEFAIKLAEEAIKARLHLNHQDKINILRWTRAAKETDKTINALKK